MPCSILDEYLQVPSFFFFAPWTIRRLNNSPRTASTVAEGRGGKSIRVHGRLSVAIAIDWSVSINIDLVGNNLVDFETWQQ